MCDRVFHSMKLRVSKKVKSVARKLRFVGTPDKEGKTDEDIINKNYTVAEESVRSRVAMDFTGAVGRIVEDPREATAIAAAEGYSWKRRWRGCTRAQPPPLRSDGGTAAPAPMPDIGIHTTQPWFHGGMTRDKAAELVSRHGTVDGVFLVRDSRSHPGSYVITYKCGNKTLHAQVNPIMDPLRDRTVFSIDNGATKFYDLLQLVEFYQLNAGCLPTRLTHYVTFLLSPDNAENREQDQNRGNSSRTCN